MNALREDAVAAVGLLEAHGGESVGPLPTPEEYVDTVLAVVSTRLTAVVLDLHTQRILTPAGARAVHSVLQEAGLVPPPPDPGVSMKETSSRRTAGGTAHD